ncbi:MAG TPA: TolC family protein, partial [Steroidobacteraceae bacterium]|nr:TolC family protein [Steroidobacteraceae bacterium]
MAGLNDVDLALVRSAQATANAANDAALVQFFPWLSVGGGYDRHSGATTEVGRIVEESSEIANRGAALNEQLSLGDAVFARLAAQQRARAAGYDVQASQNDTALAAAGEYFDLVNAIATADITAEAVRISQQYADQLDRAYQIGLANHSDLLRVAVQTQRDRVTQRGAEAAVRSASAALATLLRLDPAIPLEPSERIVSPPTLVPIDTPLASLVK